MGKNDPSPKKLSRPGFNFEPGFKIELLEGDKWYICKILEVDWEKSLILIHYNRWSHKFDEWVPMSSPDIRPCQKKREDKKHFRVREDVFALWGGDGKRYPGSIQAVLPNDYYQVQFYDGIVRRLIASKISKWTRANAQLFGTAELASLHAAAAGAGAAGVVMGPSGFVPEVLETKRRRKMTPIVEQLLGSKRARREAMEEQGRVAGKSSPASSTGRSPAHGSPSRAAATAAQSSPAQSGHHTRRHSPATRAARDADSDATPTKHSPLAASTGRQSGGGDTSATDAAGGSGRKQSWSKSHRGGADDAASSEESEEMSVDDEEEEEEIEGSADESYSESCVSLADTTASSSYRSVSPGAVTPVSSAEPSPTVTPTPAVSAAGAGDPLTDGLPAGWRRSLTRRHGCGRLDVVLIAPDGRRFRSRVELERYIIQMGLELNAYDMFRKTDGEPFRVHDLPAPDSAPPAHHPVTRRSVPPSPLVATSLSGPQLAADAAGGSQLPRTRGGSGGGARPCFSASFSEPAVRVEAGATAAAAHRPSFTSTPSYHGQTLNEKYIYTGKEVLTKKLPLGWALEPILDQPSSDEPDWACQHPDCKKTFRKESLLQMHLKHYHAGVQPSPAPPLRSLSSSEPRSTTSRPSRHDSPQSRDGGTHEKLRLTKPQQQQHTEDQAGAGRAARRLSRDQPASPAAVAPPDRHRQGALAAADDPKLRSEPVVPVSGLVDGGAYTAGTETPCSGRAFRRPRRRQPTADSDAGDQLIQIVDSSSPGCESPQKARAPAAAAPPGPPAVAARATAAAPDGGAASGGQSQRRSAESADTVAGGKRKLEQSEAGCTVVAGSRRSDPYDGVCPPGGKKTAEAVDAPDRGDGARTLLSAMSVEEQIGSPSSPAASSVSVRDTDAAADEEVLSETGGDKLGAREVIHCDCGQSEDDGLMIQCELCLSWQHGRCLGIGSGAEAPVQYVCATCRHPWRVRRSQRYVWDQQLYRDGTLMRLPFTGAAEREGQSGTEQAEAVMRAAVDLTANVRALQRVVHSLRTKIAIASNLNHPKLYLWARPWSPVPPSPSPTSATNPEVVGSNPGAPTLPTDWSSPAALLAAVETAADLLTQNDTGGAGKVGSDGGVKQEEGAGGDGRVKRENGSMESSKAAENPTLEVVSRRGGTEAAVPASALRGQGMRNGWCVDGEVCDGQIKKEPNSSDVDVASFTSADHTGQRRTGVSEPEANTPKLSDSDRTEEATALKRDSDAEPTTGVTASAVPSGVAPADTESVETNAGNDSKIKTDTSTLGESASDSQHPHATNPAIVIDDDTSRAATATATTTPPSALPASTTDAAPSALPASTDAAQSAPAGLPAALQRQPTVELRPDDGRPVAAPLTPSMDDGENPLAALNSDERALLTASLAAAAAPPAGIGDADAAAGGDGDGDATEESEDPLRGMLDDIVDLLPSQSELEQLLDPTVEPDQQAAARQTAPPTPVAPVGEARIDPLLCQQHLWTHVTQMQVALLTRLDAVQAQIEALEKVADLTVVGWSGDRGPAHCRRSLQTSLRDVTLVQRMAELYS